MSGIIFTLEFQGDPPSPDMLSLIDSRIQNRDKWVAPGPIGPFAQYRLCDYDFPGFKGESSIVEQRWRSPILDPGKLQAILHVIGYPNYLAYMDDLPGRTHRPDSFDSSDPSKLTPEEVQMVWVLFPELKQARDQLRSDSTQQAMETDVDLI